MSGPVQYLLDTNVLSETRKRHADERVMAFVVDTDPSTLYLSVLTLGELRKGVALKQRSDPDAAASIAAWVDGLEFTFASRILNVDAAIAQIWGDLSADRSRPPVDALLAATAIAHDLALVTRNVQDMQGLSLRVLNPWEKVPYE